jgi:polyribonucleotide nucleotidyltransferase
MVESEAHELSEDVMLGAVVFGHEQMQAVINVINEMVEEAGKPEWNWTPPAKDQAFVERITNSAQNDIRQALPVAGQVRAPRSPRRNPQSPHFRAGIRGATP